MDKPQLAALALIILGEALSIWAEMKAARGNSWLGASLIAITLAGGLLIAGYMLGYSSFKNIWIVSAISITSIVIVEPVLSWLFFHELPTTGALIGMILGTIGLIATLVF